MTADPLRRALAAWDRARGKEDAARFVVALAVDVASGLLLLLALGAAAAAFAQAERASAPFTPAVANLLVAFGATMLLASFGVVVAMFRGRLFGWPVSNAAFGLLRPLWAKGPRGPAP